MREAAARLIQFLWRKNKCRDIMVDKGKGKHARRVLLTSDVAIEQQHVMLLKDLLASIQSFRHFRMQHGVDMEALIKRDNVAPSSRKKWV